MESVQGVFPRTVIVRVLQYLTAKEDVRSLFLALADHWKGQMLKMHFIPAILTLYEQNGLNQWGINQFLTSECAAADSKCGYPASCIRCYLYGTGRCSACGQHCTLSYSRDLTLEIVLPFGCDADIRVPRPDAVYDTVRCSDAIRCMTCNFTFHPDDWEANQQLRTVMCCCSKTNKGCTQCTKECGKCGKIGCSLIDDHFIIFEEISCEEIFCEEISSKNISSKNGESAKRVASRTSRSRASRLIGRPQWPQCGNCDKPHCCKSYETTEDWDGDGDFSKNPAIYLSCPSRPDMNFCFKK